MRVVGVPILVVLLASAAWGQAPAPPPAAGEPAAQPGMRIVSGQAPVVGGNSAGARERALDEAIRQAVDQTLNELLDPAPAARAAAAKNSKAILAKARSFVPRYRTLDEGEANGIYTVRLEAEVDTVALRRRIDRGAPAVAPPAAAARPGAAGVLVAPGDRGDGTAAFVPVLVAALSGSGGLRARAPDPADPKDLTDAAAAVAAARSGLNQIARVGAEVADEGVVRGTGRVAVSCHATARVTGTAPGSRPVERSGQARVFVDPALGAGRADCFSRLAGDLAPRLAAAIDSSPGPSSGDLRSVTLEAEVVEPAAVPLLLRGVRSIGAVSGAELRQVAAGRADIRIQTRAAPGAIAAALSRDVGGMITLSNVQVGGDTVRFRARLRGPQTSPAATP